MYLFQLLGSWLDVSSHNVGVPALSIRNPDCHGYLQKVGNHHKTWRRRYCVLKYACLYYYTDPRSTTAKGTYVFVSHPSLFTPDLKTRGSCRQKFWAMPPDKQAAEWDGVWEGVSLPSRSVISSSAGFGRSPGQKRILAYLCHRTLFFAIAYIPML